MEQTRRAMIKGGTLAVAGLSMPSIAQPLLRPTAPMVLGPYYPVARPLDQDADLTRVASSSTRARGEIVNLVGRVLDRAGKPIAGARIDLWQANAAGRYGHPSETNSAPLDPGFQGSAVLITDAAGGYRVKTVRPGSYDGGAPHIHFDISSLSQRLVTQMIFPDEPLNEMDNLVTQLSPSGRASVTAMRLAPLADAPGELAFRWDAVLF